VKPLAAIAAVVALATLSGCVVAPPRGYYQQREPSYDRRYQERGDHYRYGRGDQRSRDGDHAGGTNSRD
jgi:hypothetical protein